MAADPSQFSGLSLSELLQLEAELCTPLRRKDWVDSGSKEPHAVRAALLTEVYRKCKPRGLQKQHLAPVLKKLYPVLANLYPREQDQDRWLKNKVYNLFSPERSPNDSDRMSWWGSQELLTVMLRGIKSDGSDDIRQRNEIVGRIVRFFFPADVSGASGPVDLPPPFFREERTGSDHCAWPHDAAEVDFYAVSLARRYRETDKRVRWFIASGGDLFRALGGRTFDAWAERIAAALCFGLNLTFVVPAASGGTTPLHDYLSRLQDYWKTKLDLTILASRYPDLHVASGESIKQRALKNMRIKEVRMPGQAKRATGAMFTKMFPFARSFGASLNMAEDSRVYGPTFLNPWLRFHWIDLMVGPPAPSCEPQFAAIAFNDHLGKTNLVLLAPDSMTEYLKWLSAFVGG
jgi:hypothetical protein